MAKNGILPARVEMFGPGGLAQLDQLQVPPAFRLRIDSLRELVDHYDYEVAGLEREIHGSRMARSAGYLRQSGTSCISRSRRA